MAKKPIKLRIDVTKILKSALFKGDKGTYLTCAVWENRDGEGKYGDTHYVVQELPREQRESGEKGPIIGNMTLPEPVRVEEKPIRYSPPKRSGPADDDDSEIPF